MFKAEEFGSIASTLTIGIYRKYTISRLAEGVYFARRVTTHFSDSLITPDDKEWSDGAALKAILRAIDRNEEQKKEAAGSYEVPKLRIV